MQLLLLLLLLPLSRVPLQLQFHIGSPQPPRFLLQHLQLLLQLCPGLLQQFSLPEIQIGDAQAWGPKILVEKDLVEQKVREACFLTFIKIYNAFFKQKTIYYMILKTPTQRVFPQEIE